MRIFKRRLKNILRILMIPMMIFAALAIMLLDTLFYEEVEYE